MAGKGKKGSSSAILSTAKSFELFSFRPSPQIRDKTYGTKLGIFFSVIVLAIIILYMVITFQRFLDGNITVRVDTAKGSEEDPATLNMFPFSLAMKNIHNASYFTVLVQHRTIPYFGARKTQKTRVGLRYSLNDLGIDTLVPGNSSAIQPLFGDCQTQACAYFRIKVFPCANSTRRPGDPPCAPFHEIEHIVNTNYLRLHMHLTEEGEPVSRIVDISLKAAFSFKRQFRFDAHNTFLRPDYLRTYASTKYYEMMLEDDIFSIDRIPRQTEGDDTEMCKIDFELTGRIITRINKPQTSLDLIGQWAAFYGAVFGVSSFFLIKYNMYQFYANRPAWDNFDENFNPEAGQKRSRRRKNYAASASGSGSSGGDALDMMDATGIKRRKELRKRRQEETQKYRNDNDDERNRPRPPPPKVVQMEKETYSEEGGNSSSASMSF